MRSFTSRLSFTLAFGVVAAMLVTVVAVRAVGVVLMTAVLAAVDETLAVMAPPANFTTTITSLSAAATKPEATLEFTTAARPAAMALRS